MRKRRSPTSRRYLSTCKGASIHQCLIIHPSQMADIIVFMIHTYKEEKPAAKKGLLCRNIILRVLFSEQLCNIMNCCIVGGAYIPPFRFGVLKQKYVSVAEIIQVHELPLLNYRVMSFISCSLSPSSCKTN
jgi:hypothetical protein